MPRLRILLEVDGPEKEVDLPDPVGPGPASTWVRVDEGPTAAPDANGDFLADRTDPAALPGADAAHTFAVAQAAVDTVRAVAGDSALRWAWSDEEDSPLRLRPYQLPPRVTAYSRKDRAVGFSRPMSSGAPADKLFECRSMEIVGHEVGHAILDGLRPAWRVNALHTQTRALHEAWADLVGLFVALSHRELIHGALDASGELAADNTFCVFGERRQVTISAPGVRRLDNDHTVADAADHRVNYPGLGKGFDFHFVSTIVTGLVYDALVALAARHRGEGEGPEEALHAAGALLRDVALGAILDAAEPNLTLVVEAMRDRAEDRAGPALAEMIQDNGRTRGLLAE